MLLVNKLNYMLQKDTKLKCFGGNLMKKIFTVFMTMLITFSMSISVAPHTFAAAKDTTPPSIKSTNPSNNKSSVPINQTIIVTFNENILKGKTFSDIVLTDSSGFEVNYKIKIDKNVLSIKTVANLEYSTSYKLSIPANAVVDKSKNSLKKAASLNFKTVSKPQQKLSVTDIAKRKVGVVYIEVLDSKNKVSSTGSGFIVNDKIITNYHVIAGASSATVTTNSGKKYNVTGVYAYDEELDLAVLKVNGSKLPSVTLGDSDKISIGEKVVAIGSPIGLQNTVSEGIISSLRNGEDSCSIQISVPINHGSSGGALFNEYGNVIGITSAGYDTTGDLNFAIPVNLVKPLLKSNTAISLKEVKVTKIVYSDCVYEGDIVDGEPNGQGKMTWDDGTVYVGGFKDGYFDGQGTMTWSDGEKYVGGFKNGKRNGQGTYTFADGDKYVGGFKDGKFEGQGTYFYADGTSESGIWANDELITSSDGSTSGSSNIKYIDESEPNTFLDEANELPTGAYVSGYLSTKYDIDTYKVEVTEAGYYDIWSQIGSDGSYGNRYYVMLCDSKDKYIATADFDSYSGDDGVHYSNFLYKYYLNKGTYYIHVLPDPDKYSSEMKSMEYSLVFDKSI